MEKNIKAENERLQKQLTNIVAHNQALIQNLANKPLSDDENEDAQPVKMKRIGGGFVQPVNTEGDG